MAEILDVFPYRKIGGRPSLYPWKDWFDGRIWKLTPGVDFSSSLKSFRVMVYERAARRGLRVRCHTQDGLLCIQAYSG